LVERDIDENILLIHENEYEKFMGNNSCNKLKKYKDFKVQIYNSNYIFKIILLTILLNNI
jgi:hypothetical protein